MKKYTYISIFYMILALVAGVFFREFTKLNNFTGKTTLSVVHGHAMTLGVLLFLLVLIFDKLFEISKVKSFKVWLIVYNVGLIYTLTTFTARGILQVTGSDFAGLSHIAGLGHAVLGTALIWFGVLLNRAVKKAEHTSVKASV